MSRMKFIILNLGPFASLSRGNVLSKRTIQLDPLGCSSESGGDNLDSGKDGEGNLDCKEDNLDI